MCPQKKKKCTYENFVHSNIIHNKQNVETSQNFSKYPSTNGWVNKICYINTMEYYSYLESFIIANVQEGK